MNNCECIYPYINVIIVNEFQRMYVVLEKKGEQHNYQRQRNHRANCKKKKTCTQGIIIVMVIIM